MNKKILHLGIDLLSRREHSVFELNKKLCAKEFEQDEIDEVMQFLIDENYISDIKFTDMIFRHRTTKGYGLYYITQELRQKGVNSETVSQVERELDIDWFDIAEQAYSKKYGFKAIKDEREKAKRIRFMLNRGFTSEQVYTLLSD